MAKYDLGFDRDGGVPMYGLVLREDVEGVIRALVNHPEHTQWIKYGKGGKQHAMSIPAMLVRRDSVNPEGIIDEGTKEEKSSLAHLTLVELERFKKRYPILPVHEIDELYRLAQQHNL